MPIGIGAIFEGPPFLFKSVLCGREIRPFFDKLLERGGSLLPLLVIEIGKPLLSVMAG